MSHANARLTPAGRRILVDRIAAGRPVAHVAAEMGVSATTAWRWWRRFQDEGTSGEPALAVEGDVCPVAAHDASPGRRLARRPSPRP